MAQPLKVAILGGGMGGLAAAWELSRQPNAEERFEITLYQRGWRLGGKGASGAPIDEADHRIEEHGLHILMGFYEQVFEILGDCYREAGEEVALPAWPDVLLPQDSIWVASPHRDDWEFWQNSFPDLQPLTAGKSAFQHGLDQIGAWIARFREEIADLSGDGGGPYQPNAVALGPLIAGLPGMSRDKQDEVAVLLKQIFQDSWAKAAPLLTERRVDPASNAFAARRSRLRKLLSLLYLATTLPAALIAEGLMVPTRDFTVIDAKDFKRWLEGHGVPTRGIRELELVSWDSPYVRAFYDLAFSMDCTIAAGVACNNLIHILFGWKGSIYYKMDGGMGDVVFAPLHLALTRSRNVEIRYFHRAKRIHVDRASNTITKVTLEPQFEGLGDYDPIVMNPCTGLPGWPNEPLVDRMPEAYRDERAANNGQMPHDFETDTPSPFAGPDLDLVLGRDFDVVVLAISVGGLRGAMCEDLRAASPNHFGRMVCNLPTMPTRAFQLWLKKPMQGGTDSAQWHEGRALAGYETPFSSCSEMNQVIRHECWQSPVPRTLGYFCGAFADAPADETAALARVASEARSWLDDHLFRLLPGVAREGSFFWGEVVDADRGFYVRANVDPSDQYVLSEIGTTAVRLAPGDSGFENLVLAGDWVKNSLSSGCVESAARGGTMAAQAILTAHAQRQGGLVVPTSYVETDGDWVIRPPGVVEDVTMHVFLVDAKSASLREYCEKIVGRPSGHAVEVAPIFPGLVLLVFADIPRGYPPETPEDGDQAEKDMAIFVPVTLETEGRRRGLAAIVPYIYVDNAAGMVTGREVYGFPKQMARFEFEKRSFSVWSQARPNAGSHAPVSEQLVAKLTMGDVKTEVVKGERDEVLSRLLDRVWIESRCTLAKPGLGEVPLVFLKQFRDVVTPSSACHQAIVQVGASISPNPSLKIHTGTFELELPAHDKPRIARELGIDTPPRVLPVSFELKLGFRLPRGSILWQAR